jgi:NADH-quinone oxidoreductase subunit N
MWQAYFQPGDYQAVKPEILLTVFGLVILLFDFFLEKNEKRRNSWIALLGCFFAALALVFDWPALANSPAYRGFGGAFVLDAPSIFFKFLILGATAIVILLSMKYLDIEEAQLGEYYALLLFSAVGMMLMVSGADLIVLFMALEVMALCEYVLAGFLRGNRRSNEAAVKFFLLGAFSSGLLLYGMSLLYGIGGSTNLIVIAHHLGERPNGDPISWIALITLLAGLYFKVSAVPFHQWTPDVYEGAPTSITAFISVAPKVASFAFLLRLLVDGLWPLRAEWQAITIVIALATMTVGNLAAITQTNIKRFFAYSTIAHVGYLLLGLVALADGNKTGLVAIMVYLLVYALMNLGAFAVIIALRQKDLLGDEIDDFGGLIFRSPGAAVLMLIFLLSLAGIPPTAGFIGKYFIFLSLVETGHYTLAVIAVAYAVVALYYYFRIVVAMFMRKAVVEAPLAMGPGLKVALAVSTLLTVLIGVYPQPVIDLATKAIRPFFS